MLDKLELKFCYVSHLPENEAERGRIEKTCTGLEDMFFSIVYESIGERPIEIDPTGADTFGILNFAKKYLQTPQPIVSILSDPKRSLLETAIFRLNRLRSTVDLYEAAFHSKPEHYSNMEKEIFNQRFRYMREQFQNWAECINAGTVDIFEIRPTPLFEAKFPETHTKYPWQPEAAKVQRESEEFRNKRLIWNGSKNALAYIFYQLKNNFWDKSTPVLDVSNEELAEFLRANFECFKDTKITSIMAYFETPDKHPKTGKNKFTIVRGNPNSE